MAIANEANKPTEILERGIWALGCSVVVTATFGFGDFPFGGAKFNDPMGLFLGGGCSGLIGIVGIAVAVIWLWQEFLSQLRKPWSGRGDAAASGDISRRNSRVRSAALCTLAASLVMCFWLPIVILSPYWLPPAALAMFWVEQRRTGKYFAGPAYEAFSLNESKRIERCQLWGWVLSILAVAGWIRCLWLVQVE